MFALISVLVCMGLNAKEFEQGILFGVPIMNFERDKDSFSGFDVGFFQNRIYSNNIINSFKLEFNKTSWTDKSKEQVKKVHRTQLEGLFKIGYAIPKILKIGFRPQIGVGTSLELNTGKFESVIPVVFGTEMNFGNRFQLGVDYKSNLNDFVKVNPKGSFVYRFSVLVWESSK